MDIMAKRNEEELIQLAFGEVPDHEIEAWLAGHRGNQAALREFEMTRQLKSDLQMLREVPEPQINFEGVKDRILSAGPMAAPVAKSRTRWGWILAPLGAAALAVVMLNLRPKAEPNLAFNVPSPSPNQIFVPSPAPSTKGGDAASVAMRPDFAGAASEGLVGGASSTGLSALLNEPVKSRQSTPERAVRRVRRPAPNEASETKALPQKPVPSVTGNADAADGAPRPSGMSNGFGAPPKPIAAPAPMVASKMGPPKAEPTIVIIDSDTDLLTGANRATEVTTSSVDVVVGG
jgi:hypothetical protein